MPEFVAERYLSATDAASVARDVRAARSAAGRLTRSGKHVRFVRSMFIPADETCIYVFEAESIDTVRALAAEAALDVERISEAISEPGTANHIHTPVAQAQVGRRTP